MEAAGWITALVVLLVLSALISGSETALFSLSPAQLSALDEEHSHRASLVLKLLRNTEDSLSAILIANNLVNISAVLVANSLIDSLVAFVGMPTGEFVIKTVILTFFLLFFGEMLPKIAANYNQMAVVRRMAAPVDLLCRLLRPLSWVLVKMGGMLTRRLSSPEQNVSIDQLQDAIEITETGSAEDKRMLTGIVRFSSTEVVEICIPRIDVVAIECTMTFKEVLDIVIDCGFSRIPVFKEDFDHVTGILYIKDLLPFIDRDEDFQWTTLLRKAYFVPEHKKINDLLAEFQSRKIHMAIVVDEYGGTLGVATLEDILEEIVGEINDESDHQNDLYQRISAGVYIFEGRTHLGDFIKILKLPAAVFDTEKGDADTIAGLLLEVKRDFLKQGQKLTIENIIFTALQVEGYRITKVKVELPQ